MIVYVLMGSDGDHMEFEGVFSHLSDEQKREFEHCDQPCGRGLAIYIPVEIDSPMMPMNICGLMRQRIISESELETMRKHANPR